MRIILRRFQYQYMEYEKMFCRSEICSFFPNAEFSEAGLDYILEGNLVQYVDNLPKLTYIESYSVDGQWKKTIQGMLEYDGMPANKQHTRYSVHGLHEYKGKFNPQIVRAIGNYIGIDKNSVILDPFNGSGTTLIECAHMDIAAYGTDINPMACFISNVKLGALTLDTEDTMLAIDAIQKGFSEKYEIINTDTERVEYLLNWIPTATLEKLEYIRSVADRYPDNIKKYLLLIASDLIRDYSNQEPSDLRMRRRISSFPDTPFEAAFCLSAKKHLEKIKKMQSSLPNIETANKAYHCDIKYDNPFGGRKFDAAITSPPYVTALPYIDTQRISLVWLNLCRPSDITSLEASLIGSRELLKNEKQKWATAIVENSEKIPDDIYSLISEMNGSLSETDGFRKQAVPALMYRYFVEMQKMFINVHQQVKENGKYALVVGHNKTTLGGKTYLIDTPKLLSIVAASCGWKVVEILPLQTYKRYGLNSKNAINKESLIVLANTKEVI